MVYPVLLWLVGFGGYLAARQPEQAPPGSLPATTAQALNGPNAPVSSSREQPGRAVGAVPPTYHATR